MRPTGVFKRQPASITTTALRSAAQRLSKSDWIDLYADLYRQTHGEEADEIEILRDAANRSRTLNFHGYKLARLRSYETKDDSR